MTYQIELTGFILDLVSDIENIKRSFINNIDNKQYISLGKDIGDLSGIAKQINGMIPIMKMIIIDLERSHKK